MEAVGWLRAATGCVRAPSARSRGRMAAESPRRAVRCRPACAHSRGMVSCNCGRSGQPAAALALLRAMRRSSSVAISAAVALPPAAVAPPSPPRRFVGVTAGAVPTPDAESFDAAIFQFSERRRARPTAPRGDDRSSTAAAALPCHACACAPPPQLPPPQLPPPINHQTPTLPPVKKVVCRLGCVRWALGIGTERTSTYARGIWVRK